jgi:cysteine-rich repeat protein
MLRNTHASLLVTVLLAGCSLVVESTLEGKQPLPEEDGGPTGRVCSNDADCLLFPDHILDCTQRCVAGVCVLRHSQGTPDGTSCGPTGDDRICVDQTCVNRACGDGYVDREATPREYCDDGDTDDADGCNNMCTRPCVAPAPTNCSDGNPCNGAETCGAGGVCEGSALEADGTSCMIGGDTGTCRRGACVVE